MLHAPHAKSVNLRQSAFVLLSFFLNELQTQLCMWIVVRIGRYETKYGYHRCVHNSYTDSDEIGMYYVYQKYTIDECVDNSSSGII